MGVESKNAAIEKRLSDGWSESAKIAWPNVAFEPPTDGTAFIRLKIIHGTSRQASIETTPLHRSLGSIVIQVFTTKGIGTKQAEQLADTAATIYRSSTFSGITVRSPSIVDIGEIEDWYQMNVNMPFYADETY